ncbi:unnamed protein product [Lactuca virosa]|uniref:RING-type E3 ubiquitin transferase n=1 Tax=Lactuca virosa TaxID=75947 RepID=A0AAU9MA10_9ASTR|nr:unnamed protein product [Lactuca virosa]
MSWFEYEIYKKHGLLESHQPISSFSPPFSVTIHKTANPSSSPGVKISPVILIIIIILAVLFFISGLLHLLVRFLTKYHSSTSITSLRSNRYPSTPDHTLQRQLQQLFHLHDSGLEQSFIDTLPVFMYKEVVGANNSSFDCAVCLSEFSEMDKLRLLPTCSHAFHINCIDTWLLSNSTCPLCRNTLFNPGFSIDNPIFEFDEMREADETGLASAPGSKTVQEHIIAEKGVFLVRLGKFRKLIDGGEVAGGETSSSNLDARRCYSMGSYEYVVGDSSLRLALNHKKDHQDEKITISDEREGKKINIGAKTDSYSVSKIWLWSKKGKFVGSSENQMHNPSSVDMELPWMSRIQGT